MTARQRREFLRLQLVMTAAAAGDVPVEITAAGIRLRDDLPIGLVVSDAGAWALGDRDVPVPFVVAS